MSRKALGTLLVCISATAFGTYALFATKAGEAGLGPFSMLFYRFAIASVVLAGIAAFSRQRLDARKILPLAGLGILYVGQSFAYIQCLRASNPITTSLLLYLYPAFVTAGSVLFLHERMTVAKVTALLCAFLGSLLLIAGPSGSLSGGAVAYGLATALFYATYLVAGKRVLREVPAVWATLVIFLTVTLVYAVAALSTGLQPIVGAEGWIAVMGISMLATVVAIGCLLWGLERVSPVEASSLSALEPLVTAVIALGWQGQQLRISTVVGGALVLAAVAVLARASVQRDLAENA